MSLLYLILGGEGPREESPLEGEARSA
jgi:hypothetical protein